MLIILSFKYIQFNNLKLIHFVFVDIKTKLKLEKLSFRFNTIMFQIIFNLNKRW